VGRRPPGARRHAHGDLSLAVPLTPSQTVGPFFGFALPDEGGQRLVGPATPAAIRIEGQVLDGEGEPVPDALVEVWQADQDGTYRRGRFGRSATDAEGLFHFVTVKPGGTVGPDGRAQAPHLNVVVFMRGLLTHLVTRMYFPDEEEANAADPVLELIPDPAARATLVARREDGKLRFDIHLQGEQETTFLAF
jgi:protocatechuate 3,4-dioxygenase alpha subunit